jgi:tetratricopeptide (TPR) repeat protein
MSEPTAEHNRIAGNFQKAREYATTDPEVSLSVARKVAEAICKHAYNAYAAEHPDDTNFKKPAEKQMLNDLVARLERVKAFPLVVSTGIRTIQAFGNIGSHDQGDEADHVTSESIQACISGLESVVRWFWRDQGLPMELLGEAGAGSSTATTAPPSPAPAPVAASTPPADGSSSRVRNMAIALAAGVGVLASVAGLFADSLSTLDQLGAPSAEMVTAQAAANGLFNALGDPAPPEACYGDDPAILSEVVAAGDLLKGALPDKVRPQESDARSALSSLTDKHPDQATAWALLAAAQLAVKEDAGNVAKSAKVAARLCDEWAFPANVEGNALFRSEDLDGAEIAYKSALGLYPEYAAPRFNLALLSMKKKDFATAEAELSQLIEHHPHHENAHLVRGQARMMSGSMDGALEDVEKAVEQDPRNATAYAMLGQVLRRTGKAEESRAAMCRAKAMGHPQGDKICPED